MANRHLARTIALQSLFEWDFNNNKDTIELLVTRNRQEFAPDFDDQGFCLDLVKAVIKNQKKIDTMITKFAPEWPLDQITTTDRNVLRIGVYELRLSEDIPPKVAINESIELAKALTPSSVNRFFSILNYF